MEIGKLPERMLQRSVIDKITAKRPEVLLGAGVGEDCAALRLDGEYDIVLSTDPITATGKGVGRLAVIVSVNDLASSGAEAIGLMVTALFPPSVTEEEIAAIMSDVDMACRENDVCVMGGHTEITNAVKVPLLSVTGIGRVRRGRMVHTGGAKPGMDVIVTKWIGLEGTSIIAKEKREVLAEHLPESVIERAASFDRLLSVKREGELGAELGAAAMHDVTEGGIYGALWELCEASGAGLLADLSAIPIKQETVEICEVFHIDPYRLISSGSMLMAAYDGEKLVEGLRDVGIHSAVIGKITEGNDRILTYKGGKRYLTPPDTDEIYKVLG